MTTQPSPSTAPLLPWYRIDLAHEVYEGGEADVIEDAFRRIYFARNAPPGMAMLSGRQAGGDGFSVYFTPRSLPHARALVLAWSAIPVDAPVGERLTLRVGDAVTALSATREF